MHHYGIIEDKEETIKAEMEPVVVDGFKVYVDEDEVRRLLGMKSHSRRNERVEEVIKRSIELSDGLIEPRGIYTIINGKEYPGSDRFAGLDMVAFCVCTIGENLEKEVGSLTSSDRLLEAVVLDSIGSVAAEGAAEHMDMIIQAIAAEMGLKTSCRASPGYGDWDVREQEKIFEILPASKIGVRLTESFMMIPRKSVSFAIDIAERPARMRSENSCRNCPVEDCPYRLI